MLRNLAFIRIPHTNPVQLNTGARLLYTAEAINLNTYLEGRERAKLQFNTPQMQEKFRIRMQEFLKSSSTNLIFSEDLKNMTHLANGTPEDINLLEEMLKRYTNQSLGAKFGVFNFGPIIMRFFHHANKPHEMLQIIKNPDLAENFDQFMTYQIALDLLVKNKLYDEAYEVFSIVQKRAIRNDRFPRNCFILVMCALYNQNTPEAYNKMIQLLEDAKNDGSVPVRRALTFAAALALNQGQPQVALNILSASGQLNYITVRNMRALAFAKAGRLPDALTVLRTSVDYDPPEGRKRTILKEVFELIRGEVKASNDKEIQLEFDRIEKACINKDLFEDASLDGLLNMPIEKLTSGDRMWNNEMNGFDRNAARASFKQRSGGYMNDRRNSRNEGPRRRPSLLDME